MILPELTQAQMNTFHNIIKEKSKGVDRPTVMALLLMELQRQALQHRDECRDSVISYRNDEGIAKQFANASKFAENITWAVFELTAPYSDTNLKAKTDNIKAHKEWMRQNDDK